MRTGRGEAETFTRTGRGQQPCPMLERVGWLARVEGASCLGFHFIVADPFVRLVVVPPSIHRPVQPHATLPPQRFFSEISSFRTSSHNRRYFRFLRKTLAPFAFPLTGEIESRETGLCVFNRFYRCAFGVSLILRFVNLKDYPDSIVSRYLRRCQSIRLFCSV